MSNLAFPVPIQTMVGEQEGITIYFPKVFDLPNVNAEQKMNQAIVELVNTLIRQQYEQQSVDAFEEMMGTFEIKANERNVLSLTLSNYAYAPYHANALTIMKSLTFDVQTGESYNLEQLFKPNSHYVNVLSSIVEKQIEKREIDILNSFPGISPDQDFYLADQVLVLYFQPIEITPHYVGIPLFPIPIYEIKDIINEEGPLERLLGN